MDNSVVKYICYYNGSQTIKRNCVPSAVNKIDYIVTSIAKLGYDVEIVSVSQVLEPKLKYYKSETETVRDGVTVRYFSSIGGAGLIIKILRSIWQYVNLFWYLLFKVNKRDLIIAYHSLGYRSAFVLAKKIKGFKLIYEVEEVYSDVIKQKFLNPRKMEMRMIAAADAYIFPTEMLNKTFNTANKPYIIIYGSYQYVESPCDKFKDGKIHIVYAGTFDPRKGGAAAAADAAAYLPQNYHMHICGFGSDDEVKKIVNVIENVSKISQACITYEGLKLGKEYADFIQKCDIGLSTQDPTAKFNNTSFPSKILSYMSNGLSVVSIEIEAIKCSLLSKHINFYEIQDAQHIADAIIKTIPDNNNVELIKSLDLKFKTDLQDLLNLWNR